MPLCEYKPCSKPFERETAHQRFCKRPECFRAREIDKKRRYRETRCPKNDLKVAQRAQRKPCRRCGTPTLNHFGLCNDCRERIISAHDMSFELC